MKSFKQIFLEMKNVLQECGDCADGASAGDVSHGTTTADIAQVPVKMGLNRRKLPLEYGSLSPFVEDDDSDETDETDEEI